jgi:hypothetical protein
MINVPAQKNNEIDNPQHKDPNIIALTDQQSKSRRKKRSPINPIKRKCSAIVSCSKSNFNICDCIVLGSLGMIDYSIVLFGACGCVAYIIYIGICTYEYIYDIEQDTFMDGY